MPGYYHIPRYFDLYQTTPNYFHIILGTCAPNPAACFCCSHRTCTPSRARGAGSRAAGEQTRPATPRATSPPLSAGPRRGLSRSCGGTFPAGRAEGSRGQAGPAPRHAYFLPPACAGANSGVHKTGLHQTDQPPASPRHYPRHKS